MADFDELFVAISDDTDITVNGEDMSKQGLIQNKYYYDKKVL